MHVFRKKHYNQKNVLNIMYIQIFSRYLKTVSHDLECNYYAGSGLLIKIILNFQIHSEFIITKYL